MTKSCPAGGKTPGLIDDGRIGLRYSRSKKEEKKGSRVRSRITLASGGRGEEKIRRGDNARAALAKAIGDRISRHQKPAFRQAI